MMFDAMWKTVFLCTILVIGDPFVVLNAQSSVPVEQVAQNHLQDVGNHAIMYS